MRPGSIAVALAATAVAVGGIYLFLSLDSEAPTPDQALAEARAERATPAKGKRAASDRTTDRARPGQPQRRTPRDFDPDSAPRSGDLGKHNAEIPEKFRNDLANPKEYEGPSVEQSDTLTEANKLYDKGDFDGARALAQKMLVDLPGNVKMLRVVVSSSCILGEGDVAQQYVGQLPPGDHAAMVARCAKFQIDLK